VNASTVQRRDSKSASRSDDPPNSVGGDGTVALNHSGGLLPNACLPCLAGAGTAAVDKRSSFSLSTSSSKKKAPSKLSFKRREGHADLTICECFATLAFLAVHFSSIFVMILSLSLAEKVETDKRFYLCFATPHFNRRGYGDKKVTKHEQIVINWCLC
jgi:hypothetical protein